VHLGASSSFPLNIEKMEISEDENIRNTLVEFALLSKSKKIYTYPGSGFSEMCSKIYDIPYISIS